MGQGSDGRRRAGGGPEPVPARRRDCLSYLELLAGQIASRLAGARVYDAERLRAATLAEAVALRDAAADALAQANQQLTSEVALRTQERDRMRRLFEQAPSFMALLLGREHRFVFANAAYMQLVGHREVVGLTVREALPEIAGQGFFELLDNVFDSATPFVGTSLAVQLQRAPAGRRRSASSASSTSPSSTPTAASRASSSTATT